MHERETDRVRQQGRVREDRAELERDLPLRHVGRSGYAGRVEQQLGLRVPDEKTAVADEREIPAVPGEFWVRKDGVGGVNYRRKVGDLLAIEERKRDQLGTRGQLGRDRSPDRRRRKDQDLAAKDAQAAQRRSRELARRIGEAPTRANGRARVDLPRRV